MKKFLASISLLLVCCFSAFGEGTQTWRENSYDDFSRGTPKGIAVRGDGALEMAPSFKPVSTLPSTFIWSIVSDSEGIIYVATGAPARVYRIKPDGAASVIFQPKELQVQALAINPKEKNGVIYAATSPDGKVYRIERGNAASTDVDTLAAPDSKSQDKTSSANLEKDHPALSSVPVDLHYTATVLLDPKTKYIWDIAIAPGNENLLYVATGDRGEIFRVTTSPAPKISPKNSKEKAPPETTAEGSLFFKSDESHIRTLAFDSRGNLIAGSDGSGLIYRISPAGEGFVIYSAPKKEITALALDDAGNIYAAGIGEKRSSPSGGPTEFRPPFPASSPAPGSGNANANASGAAPLPTTAFSGFGPVSSGGSEIYMIAADGSPTRLWSSKEDIIYALAFDSHGRLLAGSGNKGHIIALETKNTREKQSKGEFLDLVKASATQVTGFSKAPGNALYVATSNLGKIFVLGPTLEKEGTFESGVFDAHNFSLWGRAEIRGSGNFEIYARSGNVDNPDRNWSAWKKVDLAKDSRLDTPPARFIQWKAVMKPSSDESNLTRVDSVAINYLPKNVAPVIDEVSVHVGSRTPASNSRAIGDSAIVGLGRDPGQGQPVAPHFDGATPPQQDHGSATVRWAAHDDNDDTLTYSVYYKGDGELRWKLLKDKIADKVYSWDAGLLPDGGYTVRVVASDAPSHSPEEALSDFKDSARFEIDNTPPRIDALNGKLDGGMLHISFSASDSFSPIHHAEFSVDAGEWQYIAPVGELSDSLIETYDFNSLLPSLKENPSDDRKKDKRSRQRKSGGGISVDSNGADDDYTNNPNLSDEHVIVVRVHDRFDNVGIAKVIVK